MEPEIFLKLAGPTKGIGFSGVAATGGSRIVILPTSPADQGEAEKLYAALEQLLHEMGNVVSDATEPTDSETHVRHLLVVIGSKSGLTQHQEFVQSWANNARQEDTRHRLIPALNHVVPTEKLAEPVDLRSFNFGWWHADIEELVPPILLSAGIVQEEFRIFLSY